MVKLNLNQGKNKVIFNALLFILAVCIWLRLFINPDIPADATPMHTDDSKLCSYYDTIADSGVYETRPVRNPFSRRPLLKKDIVKPLGKISRNDIIHIEVSGIIRDNNRDQALLYQNDTVLRLVSANDTICSFRVRAISDSGLLLSRQGGDTILTVNR